MKKMLILLSVVVASILVSCENENVTKLKSEIEAANKQCPMNMGMMGDILSVKYDEKAKEVQMYYSINEDIVSIEALTNSEQMVMKSMRLSVSRNQAKEMLILIVDAGAGLSVTYKSASTGKTFKVSLTSDDLKEVCDNPMSEMEINQMWLENSIAIENARCPYLVDEGMEMVQAYDDGTNIICACRIDEDMYDFSILAYSLSEIKQNTIEMFDDPLMKRALGVIHLLGKGFVLRYCGDTSAKTFDITFTNEEIGMYLQ